MLRMSLVWPLVFLRVLLSGLLVNDGDLNVIHRFLALGVVHAMRREFPAFLRRGGEDMCVCVPSDGREAVVACQPRVKCQPARSGVSPPLG